MLSEMFLSGLFPSLLLLLDQDRDGVELGICQKADLIAHHTDHAETHLHFSVETVRFCSLGLSGDPTHGVEAGGFVRFIF